MNDELHDEEADLAYIGDGPIPLDPLPDFQRLRYAPPAVFDPGNPPAPEVCRGCGGERSWVWWPGRGEFAARWTPPKPCPTCARRDEQLARAVELERRQDAAGIPPKHRPYRWDRVVQQLPGEPWPTFARRVLANTNAPHIGIGLRDVDAAKALVAWEPEHGSLYLHGPVGSGKSLWVSARMTDLLVPEDGGEVGLSFEELCERKYRAGWAWGYVQHGRNRFIRPPGGQRRSVLVIDEEEIVRRVQLAWKGDQVPLLRIARADVLVYDDLGTVLATGGKASDLAATCIARLVDLRWREGRPMLVTSNRPLGDLAGDAERPALLDRRTLDRLREMVGPRVFPMTGIDDPYPALGYSWRRLPPEYAPDDITELDRQDAAAGEREDW